MLLKRLPYAPPSWAAHLAPPVHGRVTLGHLPTPLMPWRCPALADLGVEWYIKRDDMSGAECGGNKVRKLEFLLAEALAEGHDCVVTVGGLQSNHCRATAAAARLVGLDPHLVVVVPDREADQAEVGLSGNLMVDRTLGATLHVCPASDYFKRGGDLAAMDSLNSAVADELRGAGRRPYVVPVGGTTPMSAWGYIRAVEELIDQSGGGAEDGAAAQFDHIVFAAGSGGTATGLALGCALSGLGASTQLHAVNVQHTPDDYYRTIDAEAEALGARAADGAARRWLTIHDGGGDGYARATKASLEFILDVARQSGVLLDHVYTGKALYYFEQAARADPDRFRGKRVLFWHTGGMLGIYAVEQRLQALLPPGDVKRVRPPPSS